MLCSCCCLFHFQFCLVRFVHIDRWRGILGRNTVFQTLMAEIPHTLAKLVCKEIQADDQAAVERISQWNI